MVSKLYHKAHIHDVQEKNCTAHEREMLLDIFEELIKKASALLIQKADFHLSEFSIAKLHNLTHFSLHIERQIINKQEQWKGTFLNTRQDKSLGVLGSLDFL